jgi:tetratricopeptide (TPR) repeat protein
MSRFQDIIDEARELYNKDRKYDAAVMCEQARRIAKADQMAAEAAKAGVCAAICWYVAAHPLKASGLLMEILTAAEDDLDILSRWYAKQTVFEISRCYSPELAKLQQRLEALAQFQQEYPELPIADVYTITGDLLQAQGQWQAALTEYELAGSENNDEGYVKYPNANEAVWCNLRLGNLVAAQRWCDLLGETETDRLSSSITWYTLQANLALYGGDYAQAEAHATQAEQKKDYVQYGAGGSFEIRVRTLLVQPDLGDPAHHHHPARFRLRQRFQGKPYVFDVYDRALLIADYRLACVRYCLGVPPVDDSWYQQPQQLPTRLPADFQLSDFQRRVKLACRGIHLAQKQAVYLDGCFQCHWRQAEVQQRQTRLDRLVNATQSLFGDSPCSK